MIGTTLDHFKIVGKLGKGGMGEVYEAEDIDLLDELLATPFDFPITVPLLRLEPRWDGLRDHPRFQALLEKYDIEQ